LFAQILRYTKSVEFRFLKATASGAPDTTGQKCRFSSGEEKAENRRGKIEKRKGKKRRESSRRKAFIARPRQGGQAAKEAETAGKNRR
jgi:hypothetical protein